MTSIAYDNRPAGAGKTREQLIRICETRGCWLYAVDRREIIKEHDATLSALAAERGINITTRAVHHPTGDEEGPPGGVRVAIEALPNTYTSGHVVIWITHIGLKSADLSAFAGWHLVIDETPSIMDRDSLTTRISMDLLASLFELRREGEFSRIVANRGRVLTTRALAADTLVGRLATLHAAVKNQHCRVLTHLRSWSDLEKRSRWTWWSLWSPAGLAAFESRAILAAAFELSLSYELCQRLYPGITFQKMEFDPVAASTPRSLAIRYFAQDHVASRSLFSSPAGVCYINLVAAHLRTVATPFIWTCNKPELPNMRQCLSRGWLPPRQAGSNAWSHANNAAAIYTSKPDSNERRLLRSLNVSPERMIETRERETIYQFVSRSSVRNRFSREDVTFYVYDLEQAKALERAFDGDAGLRSKLELVDLGFAFQIHNSSATAGLSQEEKDNRKRLQARERQQAKRIRDRAAVTTDI